MIQSYLSTVPFLYHLIHDYLLWYNASDEDLKPQITSATSPLPPTPQPQQAMVNRDTQKLDILIKHVERLMNRLRIED